MVLMMETTATQWQERREGALKMLMMMRKQCSMNKGISAILNLEMVYLVIH